MYSWRQCHKTKTDRKPNRLLSVFSCHPKWFRLYNVIQIIRRLLIDKVI